MPETASSSSKPQTLALDVRELGRYRIKEVLGRGAMGVVYKAYDPVIDRMVAIKTVRLDVSVEQEEKLKFYERFFREAQAAGKLSHPNIVTIHDIGEDKEKGITFIAMELIEGVSLQHFLDHPGSLTLPQILEILREVALGLDYAHKRDIVHRDVKPANIMILTDDRVKITDFGIAKISSSALTQSGMFLGSPNYMSPEQVTEKPLDGRSDIFSLGVMCYELVTGVKPFQGEHVGATIYNVAHMKVPAAKDLVPDLPASVNKLLLRAMQKTPKQRFQSAKEVADEIDLALAELGVRRAEAVSVSGAVRARVALPVPSAIGPAPSRSAMDQSRELSRAIRAPRRTTRQRLADAALGAAAASLFIGVLLVLTSRPRGVVQASPSTAPPPAAVPRPRRRPRPSLLLRRLPRARRPRSIPRSCTVPPPKPVRERTKPAEIAAASGPATPAPSPEPLASAPVEQPPAPGPSTTPPATDAASAAAVPATGPVDRRSEEFRKTTLLNEFVQHLQNDAGYHDRLDAADKLSTLGDDRAVPYLQYSAQNDDSLAVRNKCRKVLRERFGIEVD
ncbi:MAG: protein kinase [Acidobacteriota bacterium]